MSKRKTPNRYVIVGNTAWMELTAINPRVNPEGIPFWTRFHKKQLSKVLETGRWHAALDNNGKTIYAMFRDAQKSIGLRLHVLLRPFNPEQPRKTYVDHRNGHGLDNTQGNIRRATPGLNGRNRHAEPRRNHLAYPPEVLAIMFPERNAELVEA